MLEHYFAEGMDKVKEKRFGGRTETGHGAANARAFLDSLSIEMRVIDAVEASTETKFLGETFATPVMIAPISGVDGLCQGGMAEAAKAAAAVGAVMMAGVGDEAELRSMTATGARVIKVVKPYRDKDRIFEDIALAEKAGAMAVGMDVDFVFGGKIREKVFRAELMGPQTVADLKQYVKATKLPFILKGILSESDARKALEVGAGGVIVSSHGGMVMDYAIAPVKILPAIAKIINKRIPVLVDGGLVRGSDFFKALALGATGGLLGSAVLPALAQSGAEGVGKLLSLVTDELRRIMSLTGCADVGSIDSDVIWK